MRRFCLINRLTVFNLKINTPYLLKQMRRIVYISTEQRQQSYAERKIKINIQKEKINKYTNMQKYTMMQSNLIYKIYNLKPNIQLQS